MVGAKLFSLSVGAASGSTDHVGSDRFGKVGRHIGNSSTSNWFSRLVA